MTAKTNCAAFDFWRAHHTSPHHFPMALEQWDDSMYEDVDSDGRQLFENLTVRYSRTAPDKCGAFNGMIVYGRTAFGFDGAGEISQDVHYPVIRDLCFAPDRPDVGRKLLDHALSDFGTDERIYAFFHYFGMSACARHGKLHENETHIHRLLLESGFTVEHENVYYSRILNPRDPADPEISLQWRDISPGSCREFAAALAGDEVCWGQVHFLPQGDIAYLRWIFTDGARQHQGIGTRVMRTLFASLAAMGIRRFDTDTALSNLPAQGYYEKCGFTREGITRSYYTK